MIWRYFIINLLIYYHNLVEITAYKPQPVLECYTNSTGRVRSFDSLQEYKANNISFDYGDYLYFRNRFDGDFVMILNSSDVLEEGALDTYTSGNIINLLLAGLGINEIHSGPFRSLTCLSKLDLSNNKIVELHPEQWFGLHSLEALDLQKNRIIHLEPFTFRYLRTLQKLDLSQNNIVSIGDFAFNYLINLKSLSLAYNYLTHIYQNYVFLHLSNLECLDLSYNSLFAVAMAKFARMDALESLDLSSNNLMIFDLTETDSAFEFPFLKELNLTDNSLNFSNYRNFAKHFTFDNLTIDLNSNPVHCYYIENMLNLFDGKLRLAPGRYIGNDTHINHIKCMNIGISEKEVQYLNDLISFSRLQHIRVMTELTGILACVVFYIIVVYFFIICKVPCCRQFQTQDLVFRFRL